MISLVNRCEKVSFTVRWECPQTPIEDLGTARQNAFWKILLGCRQPFLRVAFRNACRGYTLDPGTEKSRFKSHEDLHETP